MLNDYIKLLVFAGLFHPWSIVAQCEKCDDLESFEHIFLDSVSLHSFVNSSEAHYLVYGDSSVGITGISILEDGNEVVYFDKLYYHGRHSGIEFLVVRSPLTGPGRDFGIIVLSKGKVDYEFFSKQINWIGYKPDAPALCIFTRYLRTASFMEPQEVSNIFLWEGIEEGFQICD